MKLSLQYLLFTDGPSPPGTSPLPHTPVLKHSVASSIHTRRPKARLCSGSQSSFFFRTADTGHRILLRKARVSACPWALHKQRLLRRVALHCVHGLNAHRHTQLRLLAHWQRRTPPAHVIADIHAESWRPERAETDRGRVTGRLEGDFL